MSFPFELFHCMQKNNKFFNPFQKCRKLKLCMLFIEINKYLFSNYYDSLKQWGQSIYSKRNFIQENWCETADSCYIAFLLFVVVFVIIGEFLLVLLLLVYCATILGHFSQSTIFFSCMLMFFIIQTFVIVVNNCEIFTKINISIKFSSVLNLSNLQRQK